MAKNEEETKGAGGLDYGYGFDVPTNTLDGQVNKGNFHFLLGQQF